MHRSLDFETLLRARQSTLRVRIVLDHASRNLQRDLSLSELAAISNVGVSHICHLFKAELGMSPARCIKLIRLKAASVLLATTPLSVKEIMREVGFNDASHFVRDFKKLFGKTPSQYRYQLIATRTLKAP